MKVRSSAKVVGSLLCSFYSLSQIFFPSFLLSLSLSIRLVRYSLTFPLQTFFTYSLFLILHSHTTGEFNGSQTGSILPSQFQKMIVRKLSLRCGSKNYGTCFEHSRLRTKSRFVRNHMTTC